VITVRSDGMITILSALVSMLSFRWTNACRTCSLKSRCDPDRQYRCGNRPTSAIERLLRGHSAAIAAFQLELLPPVLRFIELKGAKLPSAGLVADGREPEHKDKVPLPRRSITGTP